jgi:hypothetical protein
VSPKNKSSRVAQLLVIHIDGKLRANNTPKKGFIGADEFVWLAIWFVLEQPNVRLAERVAVVWFRHLDIQVNTEVLSLEPLANQLRSLTLVSAR